MDWPAALVALGFMVLSLLGGPWVVASSPFRLFLPQGSLKTMAPGLPLRVAAA